jgi:hypothetical protein
MKPFNGLSFFKYIRKRKLETMNNSVNPFGTTFEIEVDNDLGLKKCTVNYPNRKDCYIILRKITSGEEGAEYEVGEMILSKGFVNGDPEFLTDERYIFMGALQCVAEYEKRTNFIKKN